MGARPTLPLALTLTMLAGPVAAQQAHVNLDWDPQRNTEGLTPYGARVVSPVVHDDRTVTFRVPAPEATQVALAGRPLFAVLEAEDSLPMKKGEDGVWEVTIGPVPADIYIYKIRIDGVDVADPNNTVAGTADQPPYSLLVVHGDGPAYYDAKPVPHGTVTRHVYHSKVTRGERELYVYTPPGYDPMRRYPVLYLMGGSGELASNWMIEGRANFIMDNLLAEDGAVPMVIVVPNNQLIHRRHPEHRERTFDLVEAELKQHVLPLVESRYSVETSPRGRAIAGLSMGGRHTIVIGLRNLDLFGSLGVLSAGIQDAEERLAPLLSDPAINDRIDYLLVGQGALEARPDGRTEVLRGVFEKHGIEHEYYVGGNAHDWATWRHLLHEKLLPGLWRKRPASSSSS
jgi:enterochelin esterase-like enzyme